MELKPRYKLSEVGVIPDDWDARALGCVGEALIGLTYRPEYVRSHGTLVLRASNIQNDKLTFEDNVYVDMDIPERIMVRPGDVLVCVRNGSRQLIGKSALIDRQCIGMTFGAFMAVHRGPDGPLVNYCFQSEILKRQINEHLGATINQITNRSLNAFRIPYPPTEAERQHVSGALSDVDALVDGLDRLIAKKRDLKQAAMQQLLTGQTRLPGYSGIWDTRRFTELAVPQKERIDPRRLGSHDFCIELEHIEQGTGNLLGSTTVERDASLKSVFRAGDVLFGKLRAYLRKYWLATMNGVCSTEIWVFRANESLTTPEFLFQLVKLDRFIVAASSAYGTHMPRSDWNVVRNIELGVPQSLEEQGAIATVLADMDAEIEALERRRDKTRFLKQAMMQELLTGKTRLVLPHASPEVANA